MFQPTKLYDESMSEKVTHPMGFEGVTVVKNEHGYALLGAGLAIEKLLIENGINYKAIDNQILKVAQFIADGSELAARLTDNKSIWLGVGEVARKILATQDGKTGANIGPLALLITKADKVSLAAVAGPQASVAIALILAQVAIQEAVAQIINYLTGMGEKIEKVLKDQQDQAVANIFKIRQAVTEVSMIRDETGTINEVAWSKVATLSVESMGLQKYPLQKIEALMNDVHSAKSAKQLQKATDAAMNELGAWLGILGNAVLLQDELSIIELDRVLTADPETFEGYQRAISLARSRRIDEVVSVLRPYDEVLQESWSRAESQQLIFPALSKKTFENLEHLDSDLDNFLIAIGEQKNDWDATGVKKFGQVHKELINDIGGKVGKVFGLK